MIAFQVISSTFSCEKTGIQKYPPSPRLEQIIVEHRLVTKYSADFYQYRTRNIDVLPITLRVFVGPGPITDKEKTLIVQP